MLSRVRLTESRGSHYHASMISTARNQESRRAFGRVAGILCTAVAAACGPATAPVVLAWEGDLAANGPSGVSGSVAVVSQYGRTEMSILVEGAETGATYRWRVNEGGCGASGADGELVGGAATYPTITIQTGSSASANANTGGMLDEDGVYAARVLSTSAASGEIVVACGELERVR